MGFTSRLSAYVSRHIEERGTRYFRQGQVRVRLATAHALEAEVIGSRSYTVTLLVDGDRLRCSCTCPYYESKPDVCKHLWATLLAADKYKHLGALAGVPRPRLVFEAVDGEDGGPSLSADVAGELARSGALTRRSARLTWRDEIVRLRDELKLAASQQPNAWPAGRQILYIVDVPATLEGQGLVVEIASRDRKANGEWGAPRPRRINPRQVAALADPRDQQILATLMGAQHRTFGFDAAWAATPTRYQLFHPLDQTVLPLMCATGRCLLREDTPGAALQPLAWDDGPPWQFRLELSPEGEGARYELRGHLARGGERLSLAEPVLLVSGGLVVRRDHVARLDDGGAFVWIERLLRHGVMSVPAEDRDELVQTLLSMPVLPHLSLPDALRFEERPVQPRPHLRVSAQAGRGPAAMLTGTLAFDYDGVRVRDPDDPARIVRAAERVVIPRDRAAEAAAVDSMREAGWRATGTWEAAPRQFELPATKLVPAIRSLVERGWHVEAENRIWRQARSTRFDVRSGIDWFELRGGVEFGTRRVELPELLAAVRRGDRYVTLSDDELGLIPEEWLPGLEALSAVGSREGDHLKFSRQQAALIDVFLEAQPDVVFDEGFARAREALRAFDGITPRDAPAGFEGELRGYQREALGWLAFLARFGFGGCLADDMGLGKTVTVLARLVERQQARARLAAGERGSEDDRPVDAPSLVVVPRSLVFNWAQEAARFAPTLRVLEHVGADREVSAERFGAVDLVITTYGTLRRDALALREIRFDYVVLDEAQAVKNAETASSKAARLLRAEHRLALSGTPVENHLGELWSLFDFLNPGLLGATSVLRPVRGLTRLPDEESRHLIARALRPFILRRTKAEVAADLPARHEQTLYCELDQKQRRLYDELRAHYRQQVFSQLDRDGLQRSRMHILEALLRLRQAACHPALIDPDRASAGSAKLDVLIPRLQEVVEEGHKALVFSQFTSLLALVRERLDAEGLAYEYLDGRTRDRASRVERFQHDPACPVFLISLKAGGLGLNLTAAEYVFLLDPWWNPAVEAQAIDRSHRIGQTRSVFAYRLIARDTVEEKVLELQQTKRDLAGAIITADNSLIRSLGREQLEILFS